MAIEFRVGSVKLVEKLIFDVTHERVSCWSP